MFNVISSQTQFGTATGGMLLFNYSIFNSVHIAVNDSVPQEENVPLLLNNTPQFV